MKIVHIIRTLDPRTGGPPQVAIRLAAAQVAAGCSASILSERPAAESREAGQAEANVPHAKQVRRVYIAPVSRAAAFLGLGVATSLVHEIRAADVLHLHGVWDSIIFAGARIARRGNRPHFLSPHGMLDPWSLNQKAGKKKAALALGYRHMLGACTALHALNDAEKDLVRPLRLGSPVHVVPNGIFPEEFGSESSHRFSDVVPKLRQRRYVLFLSRLHHKKGLDYLAQAFATLSANHPDVDLVVAGPDDGAQEDFLRLVERYGLSERVHLPGPLYGEAKISALRDAICFCLPSRQEGFSIAILESLAVGTPVVISEACHFPDVAKVGAGFVCPLNAACLAAAITQLLVMGKPGRDNMGSAGRELVRCRYTWGEVATAMLQMYRTYI